MKAKNIKTVLDNSHGAHYIYSGLLPESQAAFCDIAVTSLHKTLPVFTGGAMITVNDESLYKNLLFNRMSLHSTSPSYLTLASIDYMGAYMERYGKGLYEELFLDLGKFSLSGTEYETVKNDDRTRLVISCRGKSAFFVKRELEKMNIYPEMAAKDKLVFILTPFNSCYLTQLEKALKKIKVYEKAAEYVFPEAVKADKREGKTLFVRIEESIGKACAGEIAVYPPGTTVLRCGDIVDESMANALIKSRKHLIGLVKGLLPVLE